MREGGSCERVGGNRPPASMVLHKQSRSSRAGLASEMSVRAMSDDNDMGGGRADGIWTCVYACCAWAPVGGRMLVLCKYLPSTVRLGRESST